MKVMHVLIVENDPSTSTQISSALKGLGHNASALSAGAEALKRLQKKRYDVVIVDWKAPQIDGAEICREIRSRQDGGYTYIIILIPQGLPKERDAALTAGADDFQLMPVDVTELVMRVGQAHNMLSIHAEQKDIVEETELGLANVKLGAILVSEGIISKEQLEEALRKQTGTGRRLGQVLVEDGVATKEDILLARSIQLHVPFVDVTNETVDPFVTEMVPHEVAHRFRLLPLAMEQSDSGPSRLRVAMANPLDIEGIDLVQRMTNCRVEPCLSDEDALLRALTRAYDATGDSSAAFMSAALDEEGSGISSSTDPDEDIDTTEVMRQMDQAPVIRFVNTMFTEAVRRRASDIHIEPYQKEFVIRYRIDGQLQQVRSASRKFFAATASRIKVMSDMDIAERRLPLDGHLTIRVDNKTCDLRISTLPTQYGERITIRILDRTAKTLDLDQLGFSAANLGAFRRLITKPHGLVLVTGPTGSGKTTTLYATLKALRSTASNIITCEDPVEYRLEGISQSNVHERAGLTFARQLRAILRQDPDIILVGEIRDAETAEIAFRAALTGRLVLSTLHCNEAAGAVTRLVNIGLPPYLISSTLIGVVAQRLVVSLCPHCKREYKPTGDETSLFRDAGISVPSKLFEPDGCSKCDGVGTRGRIAVQEVLVNNDEIEDLILQRAHTPAIRQAAQDGGMRPMLYDGLEKAKEGLTTLVDVKRKVGALIEEDWYEPLVLAA
jgi:type IV pilus assembly protein PilB